jgi:hypothetical protein
MKLNKLYTESIAHFPKKTQVLLLREDPRAFVEKPVPTELAFLDGDLLDMCFENLSITAREQWLLHKAIKGTGTCIPHTNYRLRLNVNDRLVVEPVDGTETATLPEHWKQAVYVANVDNTFTWIGNKVRTDQASLEARAKMIETIDGWLRP